MMAISTNRNVGLMIKPISILSSEHEIASVVSREMLDLFDLISTRSVLSAIVVVFIVF